MATVRPGLPSSLGHYRIAGKIGAGGMGEVYRAHDQHLDRDVAIKVLPPGTLIDESARKHFHKEALILSQLNHPNVATIYDFDTQQSMDFLVMEYIPGITLSDKVAAGPLPEKEILRLGVQLAEGLSAAHEHGIVHRDLKPGNLRVTGDGRLKILDFGLAKLRRPVTDSAATESLSETKATAGTLPYMAPEQLLGEQIDARTDIHAAGSVLYEMATGQRPFADVEGSQLIGAILRRPPRPPTALNPRLSPELARIIGKCLEKEPENRYQSARELAVDLRRLGTPSAVTQAAVRRPRLSRRVLVATAAVVLAVVVLLLGFNVGGLRTRLRSQPPVTRIESLAVLPLTNFSGDPQQEYFADGMTEELILSLSKISALKVISRTSVMRYKGLTKPLPQIAKELNVGAIVEGSVLRAGGRLRITAQLIDGTTDRQLWGQSYETDLKDVLALQADVAQAIAAEIQVKLNPQEQTRLASARPVKPEAYEAYLRGRYYLGKRNQEAVLESLKYFEEAVQVDPTSALPYAGVADSYVVLASNHWLPSGEASAKGTSAALKALQIDNTLAEAHTALGALTELNWEWAPAEQEYKRGLALNPNYALARQWYSYFLSEMGRHEEAVAQARRAAELDPSSLITITNVGQALYMARRYDQAERSLLRVVDIDPNFWPAQYCVGVAYVQTGRFDEGIAALRKAAILSSGDRVVLSALAYAYGTVGQKAEAQKVLDEWTNQSRQRYGYLRALSYVGMGEKKKAIEWLEKAYNERDASIAWIGTEPMFDSLRANPRFQDLLRRMNLSHRPALP